MIGGDANGIFSKCKPYYKRKGFAMMGITGILIVLVIDVRLMVKVVETLTELVNAISSFLESIERLKAVRKRQKNNRQ